MRHESGSLTMTTKGQFIEKAAPSTTQFKDDGKGANPPLQPETPQEESMWKKASPWVHGALGVASFIPGVSVVTGGLDAAIYAGEGNLVAAGIAAVSMIPGGKVVTTAGKVIKGAVGLAKEAGTASKIAKGAHEAEEVAKAAKAVKTAKEAEEAAKLAKEAQLAKEAKAAEEAAAASKKAKKDTTVKKKKKLKCGEYGKYGELKKKNGDNKFDRDHIPSKAALKSRAEELKGGPLSQAEKNAIDKAADAIAIPKRAHINISPTYGQTAAEAAKDAKNLSGAARRDVEEMLKKIDEYDADGGCKKAYKKSLLQN
jgi:hypothetical protein